MEAASETRRRPLTRLAAIATVGSVVAGVWVYWRFGSVIVDTEVGLTPESRSNLQNAMVARLLLALLNGVLACLPVRPRLRSTALTLAFVFALHGGTTLLSQHVADRWGPSLDSPMPLAALVPFAWVGAWLIYSHPGPERQHRRRRVVGAVLLGLVAPIAYFAGLIHEWNEDVAWLVSIGALQRLRP